MIREKINSALKQAMLAKDNLKTTTIRMITSAIKQQEIDTRKDGVTESLSNEKIIEILQKLIKQRNDAIKMYIDAGRTELAAKEAAEIIIINDFMPEQLSPDDAKIIISGAIKELHITSMKDMSKIMSFMKEKYAGQISAAEISKLVKESLN